MADKENGTSPLDDSEVEIVSLDAPADRRHPTLLKPRLTTRQRKLSLRLTAVLFILVFCIVIFSASDIRNLIAGTLFRPTPVVVPKNVLFYLQGDPTWGQFTIDGRSLARLPIIGRDQPLSMPPGTHRITWQAEPFAAQTCVLTVINTLTFSSPCIEQQSMQAMNLGVLPNLSLPAKASVRAFSFFASMRDLSTEQHALLVQQLQDFVATYRASEPVSPGEVYAVSAQSSAADSTLCKPVMRFALCYAQAKQPLVAHLSVQVDTSTSANDPCIVSQLCFSNQQDCRQLCDPFYGVQTLSGWGVEAIVSPTWSYTTPAGQVIAHDQPDSAIRGASGYQNLLLNIRQDASGWHIVPLTSMLGGGANDPFCAQAMGDTSVLLDAIGTGIQPDYEQQWADSRAHLAAGCLVVSKQFPTARNSSPTPTSVLPPPAYFLQRFGVVLSANEAAHNLLPDLPVADNYERSLVQTLLATLSD